MKQLNLPQLFALLLSETRGAWRRMLFFILCIAIGVGAVMTVKSFSNLVGETIQGQAKGLLSADLAIKGSWEQNKEDLDTQNKVLPPEAEFLFIKELHGMAQFNNSENKIKSSSLITELKAVPITGPQYPFYGELKNKPEKPLAELLANGGAVVGPSFLLKTGLKLGDKFSLGKAEMRINGVVLSEPDRISRAFSIGPRVFISRASLDLSGLVQPGSRIKHRTLIRLPSHFDLEKALVLLERGLTDKSISIRTYKDMQSSLSSSIERMGQYLGALGVIALLMGGIGVAMIVRTFMAQKLDTLAILSCLGASSRTLFKVYLLQSMLMGLAGSILGVCIGFSLTFLLPPKMEGLINLKLEPVFYWIPALQSLLLGCATTLLFCLWPLIRAVKTRPLRLFRRNFEKEEQGTRWERGVSAIILGLGLAAMICWQAESIKRGLIFLAALVISAGVFALASLLLLKLLKAFPPSGSMTRRYSISNLMRPNNQATSIITCLGMGIMLILTVRLVQMDMLAMLNKSTEMGPPNYFFIDIQHDQTQTFTQVLDRVAPEAERTLTPLVRSRLHSIDDKLIENWVYKDKRREEWFITREFVLTYMAGSPPKDNEVIEGVWWDEARAKNAEVSLEQDAAKRLNAKIGSQLVIDIQGVPVAATVTSIRKVNWRNMRTNFYMIYSPGALQDAPLTYVATVHVPEQKELALQHAVVEALPNITAVSTRDIVNTIETNVSKLTTLVDFMSGFAIAAGLFILSGSIASTKFRRLQESAILKILGARRKVVASILGIEYITLGIISALVGVGLAQGLSWAVMKYMIKSDWHVQPITVAWAFGFAVLITVATGVLSSLDVICNKPLKTIRESA
ncbi:MAG: FtsX-like permease family protein [Nitrospina sp.]|jgi:putative ABC transport system permease protein|nr:FtsX-like permease family protein [Nitrospina sp.]MBT3508892.1 FtsX-like permease family protein [Nitrospina sp.]MBT3876914.1 FtsX-like permease family protein [Nitrospina sp.]MBT4047958.1 FtsX-like permease family protein [Nitrospina sp.]MBT4558866.1 FtsX-like permease family protein [Nitrospina sp.]